jgi:hypothetical protein
MSAQESSKGDAVSVVEKLEGAATKGIVVPNPAHLSPKQARIASFTPKNLTEAIALSRLMASSGVVPKEFKGKPADILVAMQLGSELGLAPLQALQGIAIINGRPTVWGDTALAVVQAHPFYEWHREEMEGSGEGRTAVCKIKRKGSEMHLRRFSVSDAKKAGLWNKPGPWQQYSDRMLQLRARGFALRDQFADALRGMNLTEELMDMPPDTSEAKKQREAATLDISSSVSQLSVSAEPNRGHNDTGFERKTDPPKEPTLCADCGKVDGHDPTCKYAQDAKTSKPTMKGLYLILNVQNKTTKNKATYQILEVVATTEQGDQQGKLYVWHKSMHEHFAGKSDVKLVAEVSEQTKDGKTFFQVEHIIELGGVPFVDDVPAQQGEMPAEDF